MAGLITIYKLREPTSPCWKALALHLLLEIRPHTIVLPFKNGFALERDQDVVHNSELEQIACSTAAIVRFGYFPPPIFLPFQRYQADLLGKNALDYHRLTEKVSFWYRYRLCPTLPATCHEYTYAVVNQVRHLLTLSSLVPAHENTPFLM